MDTSTTGGFHEWSSAYFEYAFDTPGVSGMLGPELGFYDPFDLEACGFLSKMSCLDTGRRLVAYRGDRKMRSFLQWEQAGNEHSNWTLYHSDSADRLEPAAAGVGREGYARHLASLGLDSDQVLWGRLGR